MRVEYEKIDSEGFIIDNAVFEEGEAPEGWLPNTDIPSGLYKPKYNGIEWIEGYTADEISEVQAGITL